MNITFLKKISTQATPVLIVYSDSSIEKNVFFKSFDAYDKEFLKSCAKKLPLTEGHIHSIFLPSGMSVIVVVITPRKKFTHRKALRTARRVIAYARGENIHTLAIHIKDFIASTGVSLPYSEKVEALAVQFKIANFEFTTYKKEPKEGWKFIAEIQYIDTKKISTEIKRALTHGKVIGEEINKTRKLSNIPGGDMTPQMLATSARGAARGSDIKIKTLGSAEMKKLNMGGVLGVAQGSAEKPKFIIMEYMKGEKGDAPIVLVGKGVTFDTGGLNLKPSQGIYEMHMDMSGGASVIHTIVALARLKVKKNIVGLIPAVENMPSGSSYRPGDQLRTMSGKTIEVLDTDAEGRVILADALEYAKKYKPELVIDVATLTGAAVVALGQRASALFTNDDKLEKTFRHAGEVTGDFVWPLPLWEEYEEEIKGTFGDVANLGKYKGLGGAITAATFLWQFTKDIPQWVHLDIAPRMTAIEGDFLSKGSIGSGVYLLTYLLKK